MANSRSYNIWWIAGSILLACIPLAIFFYVAGWVSGEEFSPDDFSRRTFSYNVMPLFGINVRGIQHRDSTRVFEQTLLNDGLIVDPKRPVKRWHLIRDSRSNLDSPDFDARLLCRFLDLKDENNESIWITWNEVHPDAAKQFWPIIATLARENLYLDVSELLLRAEGIGEGDKDSFLQFMVHTSTKALNDKAAAMANDNLDEDAVELFTKSINIAPNKGALLGRADCYAKLGEPEKSEQDTVAAAKL